MLQARSMTGGFSGLRKGFPSCQEPSRAGTLRAADSPSQKSGEEPSHPRGKNPAENIKGTENPADPAGFRAGRLTGEPVGCSVTTAARMGDSHMPQRDISGLIRILRGLLQNIGNTPAPASANDAMIALEAYKDRVLGASGRSPAKKLSMVKRRARAHGRCRALHLGWFDSGRRSVWGCVSRELDGEAGRQPAGA